MPDSLLNRPDALAEIKMDALRSCVFHRRVPEGGAPSTLDEVIVYEDCLYSREVPSRTDKALSTQFFLGPT